MTQDVGPLVLASPHNRWGLLVRSALVSIVAGVLLLGTASDYGITWDEPLYFSIGDKVANWFSLLDSRRGVAIAFEEPRIRDVWAFGSPVNRNLPVPVLVSSLPRALLRAVRRALDKPFKIDPLLSYRLGPCLLMAFAIGILYGVLHSSHGWASAAVAAGTLLLTPPFFAHAHFAATDGPVCALWVMGLALWTTCAAHPRRAWIVALLCGLGLASKASFILFPAVLVGGVLLSREWRLLRPLGIVLAVSPLVMVAFCPMWWSHPFARPWGFLLRALEAGSRWQIDAYYLGTDYIEHLPWHNAIVLPLVSLPPWTLALALLGVVSAVRGRDPVARLWTVGAALLPVTRLLPGSPAHDGIRLMLPSLFCLGPLAGIGFRVLGEKVAFLRSRLATGAAVSVLVALGAGEILSIHPYELSYYSELIGGLPGAERLGFEVTYWFDAFTLPAVEDVQRHLPQGAKLWTVPPYYGGFETLTAWEKWRPDIENASYLPDAQYLLLYSRKGSIYFPPAPFKSYYEKGTPLWSVRYRGVQLIGLYRLGSPGADPGARAAGDAFPRQR